MQPKPAPPWGCTWDVLVVGAGAAGLMAALELPDRLRVLVVAKRSLHANASRLAQAGLALVSHPGDSLDSHVADTLRVGAGLCEESVVRRLIAETPACLERLVALGLQFDQAQGVFSPGMAGAHTYPRLLHVQDRTGSALMDGLEQRLRSKPNCTLLHGVHVLQLWVQNGRCIGIQANLGEMVGWIRAGAVVLATGGGAQVFAQTTTPSVSTGDGIFLAWRAGAALRDMEFVQFHPTAFNLPGVPQFLISEAVRGAGARVLDASGCDLLASLPGGALAPRDQICRAMDQAMRRDHLDGVWLDLRSIGRQRLDAEFHTIVGRCRAHCIDPVTDLIPVAPAAHYWIGGIAVNHQAATTIPGLYAIGEVASTGFHGANRLAGNSLLECLLMARRFAASVQLSPSVAGAVPPPPERPRPLGFAPSDGLASDAAGLPHHSRELATLCWSVAGIARQGSDLQACMEHLTALRQGEVRLDLLEQILGLDPGDGVCLPGDHGSLALCQQAEFQSRLLVTELLVAAAHYREESRGCHFRLDAPQESSDWCSHTVQQRDTPIHSVPVNLQVPSSSDPIATTA